MKTHRRNDKYRRNIKNKQTYYQSLLNYHLFLFKLDLSGFENLTDLTFEAPKGFETLTGLILAAPKGFRTLSGLTSEDSSDFKTLCIFVS